jgi:hypothetical protein
MRKVPERGFKRLVNHDLGVYARFQVCSCGDAFCTIEVHCSRSLAMDVPLSTSGKWAPEDHPAVVLLKSCGVLQAIGDAMKAHGWHGNGSVVPTTEFKEMNEVSRQWFNVVELVWGPRTTVKIRPVKFTPEEDEKYQQFHDEWEFAGTKGLTTCPYGKKEDVLDFAECWWKRRAVPRNRCVALVCVGHWDPPKTLVEA